MPESKDEPDMSAGPDSEEAAVLGTAYYGLLGVPPASRVRIAYALLMIARQEMIAEKAQEGQVISPGIQPTEWTVEWPAELGGGSLSGTLPEIREAALEGDVEPTFLFLIGMAPVAVRYAVVTVQDGRATFHEFDDRAQAMEFAHDVAIPMRQMPDASDKLN